MCSIVLKRTRKTEESVWSEMKGALGWEQLAQKAGGWQRVEITGSDQAFVFFATLRLQGDTGTADSVGMLTHPPN